MYSPTWATWPYRSLLFATDPVALDHVGWGIIDARRVREGWQPVARMGMQTHEAIRQHGEPSPGGPRGQGAEIFNCRQPEHIILAGTLGLGIFDARQIDHRRLAWDPGRQDWVRQPGLFPRV